MGCPMHKLTDAIRRAPARALGRADANLGRRLEDAVRHHHRRRLRRHGWLQALDAPPGDWAASASAPRQGNAVDLLVDGSHVLPAIAAAIESAQSRVHLAGWYFSPDFQLEERGHTLRELLAAAAERVEVRVLAWGGSPLPLFRPDRKQARQSIEQLAGGTAIRSALDCRERPMHCHHEKLVLIDDRLAFVGGIDLTSLGGDRFDDSTHPARGSVGWHDATACLRGPAVADVAAHFALRWLQVTGEAVEPAGPQPEAGTTTVQVVRTVPEHVYGGLPRGEFTILEAYLGAIRAAQSYIYLESQFLWSPEIVEALAAKLRRPPRDDFRLVVLLPARPNNGRDNTRGQLGVLLEADGGARRFLACTLYQVPTKPPQSVYVHAKIAIVDDRWLTIGSANLNEHSLFNDTEVNLVVADDELARSLRHRLWAEHLETEPDALRDAGVAELVDGQWRPLAAEQLHRAKRGEAPSHRLAELPGVSRRSRRLLGPLDGLLVDG
jgi:phosphatidylserine/phosphatidylglycerophosphate/cardiolipin synthase-like enzyme